MRPTKRASADSTIGAREKAALGACCTISPSASPVVVAMPKRTVADIRFGASSRTCANLVASPKQIGSSPEASGSSVPVCPAFCARVAAASRVAARRSTRCRAACRAAARRRRGGAIERRVALGPLERHGPSRSIRLASAATASSISCDKPHAGLDRVVVDEVQLRHGVELQPMRQLAAQEAGGARQRLTRLVAVLAPGEVREDRPSRATGPRETSTRGDRHRARRAGP